LAAHIPAHAQDTQLTVEFRICGDALAAVTTSSSQQRLLKYLLLLEGNGLAVPVGRVCWILAIQNALDIQTLIGFDRLQELHELKGFEDR